MIGIVELVAFVKCKSHEEKETLRSPEFNSDTPKARKSPKKHVMRLSSHIQKVDRAETQE